MPEPTATATGRPPGSTTKSYPTTTRVPSQCPKCGCTKRVVLSTIAVRPIHGSIGGFAYNQVTHRRCRCEHPQCQAIFNERQFDLIPGGDQSSEQTDHPTISPTQD